MMKLVSTLVLLASLLTQTAYSRDIIGEKHTILIEKSGIEKEHISFKHCHLDKEQKVIQKTCEQIGRKATYSVRELKAIKRKELLEATGKTILDIGIVVGLAAGGAAVLGKAVAATAAAAGAQHGILGTFFYSVTGSFFGGIGGAGAGVMITSTLDKLNPVTQFRQGFALNDDILNDNDVNESDKIVLRTVKLLNQILN
jgi:hypothetical protein